MENFVSHCKNLGFFYSACYSPVRVCHKLQMTPFFNRSASVLLFLPSHMTQVAGLP